ncbi:hypothetical protein E2562_033634 [Oryza meyeriana var. granulata]|uniref:Uncharacterized protein n=1 Tax=Oryza meyeriana var. granulata TaxID=110450 RepID=A0A6G1CB96_9ORYZ|nr:hypothetical protein E2562_033634 [Oryza meyeriana var. granulata]
MAGVFVARRGVARLVPTQPWRPPPNVAGAPRGWRPVHGAAVAAAAWRCRGGQLRYGVWHGGRRGCPETCQSAFAGDSKLAVADFGGNDKNGTERMQHTSCNL